jgi:polar amino acid transport system ATP-binding protein
MTMILATHEMSFAREVADEVCFLHDAAIVERGTGDHMVGAPEHPETQRFMRRLLDAHRL